MPNFISKVSLPNDEKIYDLKSYKTQGIFYAQVDITSTSMNFTVTIPELTATEYYDGLTLLLYNGKVTSESGFTINVNGLGAKPSYSNMTLGNPVTPTNPTRDTTIFNINYAMLFVYNSTIVSGGCWICYRGYDANTNTIGYQVRTNSMRLPVSDQTGRYRLLFTSADDTHYVPANTSSATSATTAKTVNQRPIDPFGSIRYYGYTTVLSAGANVGAGYLWQQYVVTMGYSFSDGSVNLNTWDPVYLKCAPQANGSAIIDATDPYVQTLPTTDDGKIYIYLGVANAATTFELTLEHPVYYYKDGAIRVWTNPAATGSGLPTVTTADNDKVLKVVDGDWAVTNEDEIFKISVIAIVISQTEYSMTADKTYAQIVAALNANKICQVCLNFAGPDSPAYDGGYYIFNYSGSNSGILNFIMDMPSTQPASNPTFINGGTNMGMCLTCSTSAGQDTWKLSIFDYVLAPNEVVGNSTTPIYWDNGFQECSLATVASSGSYNDLSNKPTIPTVYNATLTIQKNGSTVNTFTANASSNVTANITVPTKTSDLIKDDVIPLENGGTGLNAGLVDDWYSNDILHPRFEVLYDFDDGGFSIKYTGPLDGISDIADFRASEYFKAAIRSLVPMWIGTFGGTFFGTAMVMTGLLTESDISKIYILFPDAIQYYGQYVNGLKGTLVYDENDGVYMLPSSMQPLVPGWSGPLDTLEGYLNLKEDVSNKVTLIGSSSTDDQYPSAKAVYDAVQAEVTDIPSSSVNFDDLPKIGDYAGPSGTGRFVTFLQNETGDTYTNPYLLDAPVAMMYRVKTNSIAMNNGLGIGRQKLGITGTSASYVGSTNTLFCMIANTPIMVDTTTYAPTSNLITDGIKLGFRFVGSVIYADNSEAVIDTYAIVSYSSTSGWSVSYTMFGNRDFVISLSTTFKAGRLSIIVGPAATQKTFEKTLSDFKVFRCCNLRIDYMGASTGDYPSGTSDLSGLIEPSSGWLFSFYQHDNTQTWTDAVSAVQPNIPGILLDAKEDISNKVTSVDNSSTDDQYPSAKLLYDTKNTLSGLIQDVDEAKYNITGGDITGNVTLKAPAATDSPALIFQRGTLTDNYNDWRIQDRGGYLRFDQRGSGSTTWSEVATINTTGTISSAAFSGSGASLTSLNASNISSGTLADARLPSTVEKVANKVTSLTSSSTDTEYPSAKAVYDAITPLQNTTLSVISGTTTWGDIIDAHDAHKVILYETQGTDTQLNRIYYLSSYSVTTMGTVVGGTLVFTSLGSVSYNNNVVAGYVELKWALSSGTRNSLISFADATQTVVPLVNVDNVAY